MSAVPNSYRIVFSVALLTFLTTSTSTTLRAQEMSDDMVGQSEQAWSLWSQAMTALQKDKPDDAGKHLTALAAMNVPPLRLALMADRTGTLRFEQAVASNTLADTGKRFADQIAAGRKQRMLAEDGWHFAAIGRFNYADANFKALVESNPDPVALLELARYNPNRHAILIKIMANSEVGPSAKAFMDVLGQGEEALRKDPHEITVNIERLAGTPRMVYNASNNLKASGEYAVPQLIRYLQDNSKANLRAAVIRVLSDLQRAALNPLCASLDISDQATRVILIDALGDIGYRQAIPYLSRIAQGHDKAASNEAKSAAAAAIRKIDANASGSAAALFLDLAEAYHADLESVRADDRLTSANVWYWRDNALVYVPVPREIFNDVMAMRACEAALSLQTDMPESAALWLASNFRREEKLSLSTESEDADPRAANDATRPENYPRSIYFARAAGPLLNHMVLGRAVADRDPGVALGSIAALSATAGPGSLVGADDARQHLIEALSFPHRLVRIKAGLAVGRSKPLSAFDGAIHVVPVLNEALTLSTRKTALVIDASDQARNKAQAVLSAAGVEVVSSANLYAAMDAARQQKMTHFDLILFASDAKDPDLVNAVRALRGDFITAATPIVILAKPGQTGLSQRASRSASGIAPLLSDAIESASAADASARLMDVYRRAAATLGVSEINDELALKLALDAADVLRDLAVSRSTVIEFARAEPALVTALGGSVESLRIKAASVLALIDTTSAQQSIADVALSDKNTPTMRVAAFGSLAESARTHGARLSDDQVSRLTALALDEKDLVIRTAASQALGACNLSSNNINKIIQTQARG